MSNINHLGINENFPVAGQDNDTQTFRDNFDSIKTNLRVARDEITVLEDTTAKLNQDNDFELNVIQNAVLQNVRMQKNDIGTVPLDGATDNTITVDFKNGEYQIYRFRDNAVLDFLNFPGDIRISPFENSLIGVGKVTLELYGDGTERTITFSLSGSGATTIKKDSVFPDPLRVISTTEPIIIEVWRHTTADFYMKLVTNYDPATSGTIISLNGLTDVTTENVEDNDLLVYNSSNGRWENKQQPAFNIDLLENVSIEEVEDNDFLVYNSETESWENSQFPASFEFEDLKNGDILVYNSEDETWVNVPAGQTVSYNITIADNGSGSQGVFFIDGVAIENSAGVQKGLFFTSGKKYRFVQENASNTGARLKFSISPDTLVSDSVTEYSNGVVYEGTPGEEGAYTEITVTADTPPLFLYAEEIGVDTSLVGAAYPIAVNGKVFASQNYTAIPNHTVFIGSIQDSTIPLPFTIRLPSPTILKPGDYVKIVDTGVATATNVTVERNTATINGTTNDVTIDSDYTAINFISDGKNWIVDMYTTGVSI